jgi:hypothetical protein|tara:strand:- start:1439 stop:1588 length:150 start_codon:yes stop_codon:yes gene_type:complete
VVHTDNQIISTSSRNNNENHQITEQQLVDADKEIAELKMQIAWLERSYE